VKFLYVLEYDLSAQSTVDRITPDGSIEMNFAFSGNSIIREDLVGKPENLDQFYIVSRSLKPYTIRKIQKVKMVGVCFYPWGIHAISGIPIHNILDTVVTYETIFGKEVHQLQEHLSNLDTGEEAIRTIESFVLSYIFRKSKKSIDKEVVRFSQAMVNPMMKTELKNLQKECSSNDRKLQYKFKNNVGFSLSLYQKLARFNRSLYQLKYSQSLTSVAIECGYYDQSHFIRDFKTFAGVSPGEYQREQNTYNELIVSHLNTEVLRTH
jgi:AraC-like DNA-binding protein